MEFIDCISCSIDNNQDTVRIEYYKDVGPESPYASANVPIMIQADYDMSRYTIYLISTNYMKVIESNVLVEVTSDCAREFHILMEPNMSSGEEAYYCDYKLYTEGVPEPDDNARLFAGLFIGLLLLSGRKPKW